MICNHSKLPGPNPRHAATGIKILCCSAMRSHEALESHRLLSEAPKRTPKIRQRLSWSGDRHGGQSAFWCPFYRAESHMGACGTKQADNSFKIAPTGAELTWDSRRSRRRARANHIQLDERKGFCPFIRCPILVMVTTTEPNSVRDIILTPWQGRGGERPS